ncbi:hypothetical protein [Streptomyces malaysiensis]|uniref:Uncharacterized protein n=1 Tax=Streptomyces malaysiensis subsp. samsunensis TaxID=459658 RepID=A0A9X2RZ90_STRMQ|nr:hypothetical protein [Streptomyces samsunensis]MCQ8833744.1 hypothetical protein [Streptomyces samsunensis]
MTTIDHTSRRYSPPEQEFIDHQAALRGYITSRLLVTDWHRANDLAQQTWTGALSQPRRSHAPDTDGVPGWIADQARIVLWRFLLLQLAAREDVLTPAAVVRSPAAAVVVAA